MTNKPFAKRSLGQNFLMDENISRKIVDSLCIHSGDTVIEIGPGRGALTKWIRESDASRVIAIEKDRDLAPGIKVDFDGIEVVNIDALKFPWNRLDSMASCKIVGNLPYNVASPLMWDIVHAVSSLKCAVFMIQLEVAQRLVAGTATKAYGALTAWIRNHVDVQLLFKVPPQVFRPQPKVHSAVVRFTPRPLNERPSNPTELTHLLHICFQKRRKQLGTILKPYVDEQFQLFIAQNEIRLTDRPENLSPDQFAALASHFAESRRLQDQLQA